MTTKESNMSRELNLKENGKCEESVFDVNTQSKDILTSNFKVKKDNLVSNNNIEKELTNDKNEFLIKEKELDLKKETIETLTPIKTKLCNEETVISAQNEATLEEKKQKISVIKNNSVSDTDCLAFLAQEYKEGNENTINNLRINMGIGWKRAKRIHTRFYSDANRYNDLTKRDISKTIEKNKHKHEKVRQKTNKRRKSQSNYQNNEYSSDSFIENVEKTKKDSQIIKINKNALNFKNKRVLSAHSSKNRPKRQLPPLSSIKPPLSTPQPKKPFYYVNNQHLLNRKALPLDKTFLQEKEALAPHRHVVFGDAVVDCYPFSFAKKECSQIIDSEICFRNPRKVVKFKDVCPDYWTVIYQENLIALIEMKYNSEGLLKYIHLHRSNYLCSNPDYKFEGTLFAQQIFGWWKRALELLFQDFKNSQKQNNLEPKNNLIPNISSSSTDYDIFKYLKYRADNYRKISVSKLRSVLHIGWKRAKESIDKFKSVYEDKSRLSKLIAQSPINTSKLKVSEDEIEESSIPENHVPEPKQSTRKGKRSKKRDKNAAFSNNNKNNKKIFNVDLNDIKNRKSEVIYGKSDHVELDFITAAISEKYKLNVTHLNEIKFDRIPFPDEAKIILVLGANSSGKTTFLKNNFKKKNISFDWDLNYPLISHKYFKDTVSAVNSLQQTAFFNVSSWFRPYCILSKGEKYKAHIARMCYSHDNNSNQPLIFDDFTSLIDLDLAKTTSVSLSKWIRQNNKKAIFASSHGDIVSYLQPDIVISLVKNKAPAINYNPNKSVCLYPKVFVRIVPEKLVKGPFKKENNKRKGPIFEPPLPRKRRSVKTTNNNPNQDLLNTPEPISDLDTQIFEYFKSEKIDFAPEYLFEYKKSIVEDRPYRSDQDILLFLAQRHIKNLPIGSANFKNFGVGWKRAKRLIDKFSKEPQTYIQTAQKSNEKMIEDNETEIINENIRVSSHFNQIKIDRTIDCSDLNEIELRCDVTYDILSYETSIHFDHPLKEYVNYNVPNLLSNEISSLSYVFGVILGPTGSGKSQIIAQYFKDKENKTISWKENRSIASHFESPEDAIEKLSVVCIDRETALLPFDYLSNSEKERANIARKLSHNNQIIDNFASFCDDSIARKMAENVSNYLYSKQRKGIIIVTFRPELVHKDLLCPYWLYNTKLLALTFFELLQSENSLKKVENTILNPEKERDLAEKLTEKLSLSWEIPKILITVHKCPLALWNLFKTYHYIDRNIVLSSRSFVAYAHDSISNKSKLIGFCASIIHFGAASKSGFPRMREHRTVILPQYQGLGIGTRLSDSIAHLNLLEGFEYYSKTSYPRYGNHRNKSLLWFPTATNGQTQDDSSDFKEKFLEAILSNSKNIKNYSKVYACHKYIGPTDLKSKRYFDNRVIVIEK